MNKPRPIQPERLSIAQPFSLQAEEAVIGALLTDPTETYSIIGDYLSEQHFYDPFCRATFGKAMQSLGSGETPDGVTLSAALEALVDMSQDDIYARLVRTIEAYPSSANLKNWARVVVDKAIERQMGATGRTLCDLAHAQELSSEEKLAEAHRLYATMGSTMTRDTIITAPAMIAETMAMIEQNSRMGGGMTGVTTGFAELNRLLSGYQPGDLIVVAGRPSMGKTSLVLSSAEAIAGNPDPAARLGVVLFSLEMGRTSIGMRWLALRQDVPIQHMRNGKVSPGEWTRLQQELAESADTPFHLEETAAQTVQQIAAKARRLHREKKLSAVMIDYLQLIEIGDTRNRAEGIAAVSRALKQLAKELGVPVIALSQLNRSLEQRQDKRPMMSDLRESGAIEQDADVIMFVYRDEVYNTNTIDKGVAEIIVAKQRNGGLGTVRVAFDAPTTRFHDGSARQPSTAGR